MNWWTILLILAIVYMIACFIVTYVKNSKVKNNIYTNPEQAFIDAQNYYKTEFYTIYQYKDILKKLVENYNHKGAIMELLKITKKEELDYKKWLELAAKSGDLKSITEFYAFKDFTVISTKYNEIIEALDKVELTSEEEKDEVAYYKGLVYFKDGKIKEAIPQFEQYINSNRQEMTNKRKYMLMKCWLKELNLSESEKYYSMLENNNYKIPTEDYIELYNCCQSNSDENDRSSRESMLKYAKLYTERSDADKKSSVYSDMLYLLGSECWFGNSPSECVKANDYFLTAANIGNEKAKRLFDQCGVDGVLIDPPDLTDRTYHFMFDYEITAPKKLFHLLYTGNAFEYKVFKLAASFSDEYKKSFKSLQDIINGVENLYANHVGKMIAWGLKLLMHYGIDTYNADDIINRCKNSLLDLRVPEFRRQLAAIDRRAEELNIQMADAKASRGRWTGTGYGTTISSAIGASVKASIAAGAMNAGSSILHGIGDSIVGAINNSEINSMENNVFKSPNTLAEFETAFKSACTDLYNVFFDILAEQNVMDFEPLTGTIVYNGENISALDNKTLKTKIQNHISVKNFDYAYPMLIESLRRNPYEVDKYKSAVLLTMTLAPKGDPAKNALLPLMDFAKDFSLKLKNFDVELETFFNKNGIESGKKSQPSNISLAKK